jgi:hypothetical protein
VGLSAILLAWSVATTAEGQAARVGRDVRIIRRCDSAPCAHLGGKLVATPTDSIVIRTHSSRHLAIPRTSITGVELGHNRHGARTGAIVGGISFGVMGGVMGGLACSTMAWDPESGCGSGVVLAMAVGSALIGTGLGALIGGLIAPTQWIPVPPDELRIALIRLPEGRAGVGLRLATPR